MASGAGAKKLREESTCSICLDLMTEPVSINCGHSYCRLCIMSLFENQPSGASIFGTTHCPLCRMAFKRESIRPNKHLENLIETIKEMECERVCEEHGEQLHLFCEDDDHLICWRCERLPQHKGHVTALVEDVVQGYKEQLQETMTTLSQLKKQCKNLKVLTQKEIINWEEKVELQRQTIQSDFNNLHDFLFEEEKYYLWRLEKEKEQTLSSLKEVEANLEQQSQDLNNYILELDKKCQGSAQNLLQDVKDTLKRSSAIKLDLPEPVSLNLEIMCNVSKLYFDVKKIAKSYQVIITLDSDTAHKDLRVSKSKRSVIWGYHKKKIDTPERFRDLPCVLGHQIFNSGSYLFKVILIKGTEWDVGVCLENVPRDNDTRDPESGFWAIRCCKESRYEALTSPPTPLHLKTEIHFISVFLDYDIGLVSFYDSFTNSHIFTFPKASFSGPLKAYFCIGEAPAYKEEKEIEWKGVEEGTNEKQQGQRFRGAWTDPHIAPISIMIGPRDLPIICENPSLIYVSSSVPLTVYCTIYGTTSALLDLQYHQYPSLPRFTIYDLRYCKCASLSRFMVQLVLFLDLRLHECSSLSRLMVYIMMTALLFLDLRYRECSSLSSFTVPEVLFLYLRNSSSHMAQPGHQSRTSPV
ncbi:E3 ubiquitin-protein ligase TRIM38-like [Suncus etruscus]|uniref:E3 ubiquitin-protein ligase TRIM38-like n=1 Tax=Suncus etruscus TaxID=109475 RepID=UPI00210F393F|nr:E3 ubiquitin-protein ligase TRIM38-like [Suncus etruscus]